MGQWHPGAGGVVGDHQDGKEEAEQPGGTHGVAPGPGSGHSCGLGNFISLRDDNSGCFPLLKQIGFFTLITEAARSRLYPPL